MYLVDTNVLSAGSPNKSAANTLLRDWMIRNSDGLYLSVVTIFELEDGIAKARREGATQLSNRLNAWLDRVLHLYGKRILPLDLPAARSLGRLSDMARALGQSPGLAGLAIAATARAHGYTVLTRNIRHFHFLDVSVHDPFASLPPDIIHPA